MMPKVSVVVPVYEAEAFLRRCVESLLGQTLRDLEVILVDDGSPDGCPALCDQLAQEDARVRVAHQENQGAGRARNTGITLARGEYLGFVDADDYVLPQMFQRLYQAAQSYGADLVLSGLRHTGGILFSEDARDEEKYCFSQAQIFRGSAGRETLLLGTAGALPEEQEDTRYGFSVCKNLFRRELLEREKIRFLSEREIISEDALFLLDVITCCQTAVGVPGAYYCYCRHGDSFSKSYRSDRFAGQKRLAAEMEKRISRVVPPRRYQPYLDRLLQSGARVASIQTVIHCREVGLPRRGAHQMLRDICADPQLQTVLRRYPYWELPRMQAVFAFAMRWQLTGVEQLLVTLREKLGAKR